MKKFNTKTQKHKENFKIFNLSLCLCVFVLNLSIHGEEPWGKDASLSKALSQTCHEFRFETPLLGNVAEVMIRFHQEVISPADGPRSYHKPSSSQYTLEAMRKYGFFEGFLLGCDRLMRENDDPWVYETVVDENGDTFKWDPVK